jgi:hypothetical protein
LPQQQVTPIPEQAVPESRNQQQPVIVEAPSQSENVDVGVNAERQHLFNPNIFYKFVVMMILMLPMHVVQKLS